MPDTETQSWRDWWPWVHARGDMILLRCAISFDVLRLPSHLGESVLEQADPGQTGPTLLSRSRYQLPNSIYLFMHLDGGIEWPSPSILLGPDRLIYAPYPGETHGPAGEWLADPDQPLWEPRAVGRGIASAAPELRTWVLA